MNQPICALGQSFADCLGGLDPGVDALLEHTLKLVCSAVAEGHVCIALSAYAGKLAAAEEQIGTAFVFPDADKWADRLRQSPLVGRPGDFTPLILDHRNRLYLARYWQYESILADSLLARASQPIESVDANSLRPILDNLFGHNREQPDWQRAAAAAAVLQRFCVISGGPGTGKTSAVIRILAALQMQADGKPLRVALAAPTGKAAARMQDAIRTAKQSLPLNTADLAAIPEHASTLHRLLGSQPNSVYFRHHRGNRLPVDVMVVDEASMIDLALMAKLVDALPDTARLILLGDKDQLASVEAGAVFGDICAARGHSERFRAQLLETAGVEIGPAAKTPPPLGDAIMLIRHSYRFTADSGIGELARRINGDQRETAVELLKGDHFGDIAWRNASVSSLKHDLTDRLEQSYGPYIESVRADANPKEIFRVFNRFKVLTAHREGNSGVAGVNVLMEERLRARQYMSYRVQWYPGRPVMVIHNDYNLKLFNGDIGIALMEKEELRVFFESAHGTMRSFAPGRLPPHETVYAMTVHKSQGSEFDEVLLLLPDIKTEVLNRSLLYTAVTRAKVRVEIWGRQPALEQAIAALPTRSSGLRDRLLLGNT
ncbi:MAG: exodeoxyribonuclease V subunit alpha [Pseudomonadota bacterium]